MTSGNPFEGENRFQTYVLANNQTNEFARTGLANLLLLNGGAIVALAPIGSLFALSVKDHRTAVVAILLCFVLGLISALVGYFMGFFVNSELSLMAQYSTSDDLENEIEASRIRHNKMRTVGIWGAILGIGCFITGCLIGAYVLIA
jgi:hypothetical protein